VCEESTCVFRDAIIQGGHGGLDFRDQSQGNIVGSTVIQGGLGAGLGIYGASSVNIRPEDVLGAGRLLPGPVISGWWIGANVVDGSFLRTDNAIFSGNGDGIYASRNAVIKIYGFNGNGGVINSVYEGIVIEYASTAAISVPITGNGGAGIWVGPLSFVQNHGFTTFSGNGSDVHCDHPTAISWPFEWCGN
jgi:hypothetical protein